MKKRIYIASASVVGLLLVVFFGLLRGSPPDDGLDNVTEGMKSNEVLMILGPPTSVFFETGFQRTGWEYSSAMGLKYAAIWFNTNGAAELIVSQSLFDSEARGKGVAKPTPPAEPFI